jgi:hypothetical protein
MVIPDGPCRWQRNAGTTIINGDALMFKVKIEDVHEGKMLQVDDGFDCIKGGTIVVVQGTCIHDFYVRCAHGAHYLSGQISVDGDHLIGLREMQVS